MNARKLLFVGLTLFGVHFLATALLQVPTILTVLSQSSQAARQIGMSPFSPVLVSQLGTFLLYAFLGLLLLFKAASLSARLAAQVEAAGAA